MAIHSVIVQIDGRFVELLIDLLLALSFHVVSLIWWFMVDVFATGKILVSLFWSISLVP